MGFIRDFLEAENSTLRLATPATPATFSPGVAIVATVASRNPQISNALAPAFDRERLQREADRRNAEAVRKGSTDRWCACGSRATFAWPDGRRRDVWRCLDCGPVKGEA
jgi:hypothetical protein